MGKIRESKFDIGDIVLNIHDKIKGVITGIDMTDRINLNKREYVESYYVKPDSIWMSAKWVNVNNLKLLSTNPEEKLVEDYQLPIEHEIEMTQNLRSNILDKWIEHKLTNNIMAMLNDIELMNQYSAEIEKLENERDKRNNN